MREFILIFTYVLCAFVPILLLKIIRYKLSWWLFWISWLISLIGAFFGGVFGTIILHSTGLEFGLTVSAVLALVGAWLFIGIFLTLRSIPDQW